MQENAAMSEIFVQSAQCADWHSAGGHAVHHAVSPDLRWCYLVDKTLGSSDGLAVERLEVAVNKSLAPHLHAPQEIYFVLKERAQLLGSVETPKILNPCDTVYISQNALHGLKNIGNVPFEVLWIFPTDTWAEIDYHYE